MRRKTLFVTMMLMGAVRGAHAQQSCDSLAAVKLANTTITATLVAEGPFAGAAGPGAAARPTTMPAHCEVKGVIRPTRDSEIKIRALASAGGGLERQVPSAGQRRMGRSDQLRGPDRPGCAAATPWPQPTMDTRPPDWARRGRSVIPRS